MTEPTPKPRVVITAPIEEWWGLEDMLADGMTDEQIVEVLQEDVFSLLERAEWRLER